MEQSKKQADDLPNHAFQIMQATLDMMGDVFPRVDRGSLRDVFVETYFKQEAESK